MKHLKMSPRLKKNIVLIKLAAPKWVTLPKGSTFFAKYKRVKRDVLSDNVTIRHMYKRQARRGQGNQGIKNVLVKGFRLAKKKKKNSHKQYWWQTRENRYGKCFPSIQSWCKESKK